MTEFNGTFAHSGGNDAFGNGGYGGTIGGTVGGGSGSSSTNQNESSSRSTDFCSSCHTSSEINPNSNYYTTGGGAETLPSYFGDMATNFPAHVGHSVNVISNIDQVQID